MPQYSVISRARSGVRLGKDDPLQLPQFQTQFGLVDILIKTRLVTHKGFSKPLPTGLIAEVRGSAAILDQALQQFSQIVQWLCPVMVMIGNSPIEDMIPEIGYDVSPEITEREYFQQLMPEESPLFIVPRLISAELIKRVLDALASHRKKDRIRRALGQYYQALRNWAPGHEVLALAHLWMGVEALTPAVLERILESEGLDCAKLVEQWGIEKKQLDAEVRKRRILHGDSEAYKNASEASNGFEHGYLGFGTVHELSDAARDRVATHLRRSIIDELGLDPSDTAVLTSSPYDTPGHLRVVRYLRGKLIGSNAALTATGETYPFLQWSVELVEVPTSSQDYVTFEPRDQFVCRFAEGIGFKLTEVGILFGQEANIQRK